MIKMTWPEIGGLAHAREEHRADRRDLNI